MNDYIVDHNPFYVETTEQTWGALSRVLGPTTLPYLDSEKWRDEMVRMQSPAILPFLPTLRAPECTGNPWSHFQ